MSSITLLNMLRLLTVSLLISLLLSCSEKNNFTKQPQKSKSPEFTNIDTLPRQIHVQGKVIELSPGYCGIFCQGGYVIVELNNDIPDFNFKSVCLITACLPLGVKPEIKFDVIATLYTGKETECYYQNFDKPKNPKNNFFYKLSEAETAKIHY